MIQILKISVVMDDILVLNLYRPTI